MNWTKEQELAITTRDKNILVAAAAGSGKTAVLVERIKRQIIEDQVPIDNMLIVTFTNAAAAEMKEKIRKALTKELRENPSKRGQIQEQFIRLQTANISTFHAFAQKCIKRFFQFVEVEPGFSVCDDKKSILISEEALDRLMDEELEKMEPDFLNFLNSYSSDRNFNNIRSMIRDSYTSLMAMPYPEKWLDEHIDQLSITPEEFQKSKLFDSFKEFTVYAVENALQYYIEALHITRDQDVMSLIEPFTNDINYLKDLVENIDNYSFDEILDIIACFSPARMKAPTDKNEKEAYKTIKDQVSTLRKNGKKEIEKIEKNYGQESLSSAIKETNLTAENGKCLRRLLLKYHRFFTEGKKKRKLLDFNDMEHLALKILDNPDAANYYKEHFHYIFIDEYQDTSTIQEEIIQRITRGNNLFMVGDVKQSIYRFRLADPSIFQTKYEKYRKGEVEDSILIDLNRNFRSKEPILSTINRIFKKRMKNYDKKAALYCGINYNGPLQFYPEFHVIDTNINLNLISESEDQASAEIQSIKRNEMEAAYIADMIKGLLGKEYYDAKEEKIKQISLRDIVILMSSVKNSAETYGQIFKKAGIDTYIQENDGYFNTIEIQVFMNLLSVIDNRQQDVPLISVLHSSIFGFSADQLALIRIHNRKSSYFKAFESYAESGEDPILRDKCKNAYNAIDKWREDSGLMSLSNLIWKLLMETDYYVIAGAMPAGKQRQANLRALVDKAEEYTNQSPGSLDSFIKYIDAIRDRKIPMGEVKLVGEQDDLVRIMTIHKSKGLEFPVVFLANMTSRLNYRQRIPNVVIDKDLGIGLNYTDYNNSLKNTTLFQKIIKDKIHREDVEEKSRVLYVAMTRAKEKLYLIGSTDNPEKYLEKMEMGIPSESSYSDMLIDVSPGKIKSIPPSAINLLKDDASKDESTGANFINKFYEFVDKKELEDDKKREKEIFDILSYSYEYGGSKDQRSKYSVSQLNKLATEKSSPVKYTPSLKEPDFVATEKALTSSQIGTLYHGIMERIDFIKAANEGLSYMEKVFQEFISKGIFQEKELSVLSPEKILNFFETDLGKRCVNAAKNGRLCKEKPFTLKTILQQEENDPKEILVQGVIDCYFEENGNIIFLDYKTGYINKNKPWEEDEKRIRNTYAEQIRLYSEALSKGTGKPVTECYLYLTENGKAIKMDSHK